MANQTETASRDSYCNKIGTDLANGTLDVRTGAQPANAAAARTGTLIVSIPLGATPFTTASGTGQLTLTAAHGPTAATGAGTNTAGYFSYMTSGAACALQGSIGTQSTAVTSALTAANGNVLTFASAPAGLVAGQTVSGTGVPAGARIAALVGATVILNQTSTAGVANGATITFGFDMNIDNTSIANAQQVQINNYTFTAGDA